MRISCVAVAFLATLLPLAAWAGECTDEYDYIVVGSGPGGCVFARRAAEEGYTVLLLEKGNYEIPSGDFNVGDSSNLFTTGDMRIPKMFSSAAPEFLPPYGAGFPGSEVLPSAPVNMGVAYTPTMTIQGNMKGGASSFNGMMWTRPALEEEFDKNDEWPNNWHAQKMGKAFKKVESADSDDRIRGTDGPVKVEKNNFETFFSREVINAAGNLGFTVTDDYNTIEDDNADFVQMAEITRKDGVRQDAFTSYIDGASTDVKDRITVKTSILVTKVDIGESNDDEEDEGDGNGNGKKQLKAKAVYVANLVEGIGEYYCASKGVVVAAGALHSPTILEQSGIGNADFLSSIGVEPLIQNDQVGENLQDHLNHMITFGFPPLPTLDYIYNDLQELMLEAYAYPYDGPNAQPNLFSDSFCRVLLFSKENGGARPNFEAHLLEGLPFYATLTDTEPPLPLYLMIGFAALSLDIASRGSVHTSGNPYAPLTDMSTGMPVGTFSANWASDDSELNNLAAGLYRLREIMFKVTEATGVPFYEPPNFIGNDDFMVRPPFLLETPDEMRAKLATPSVTGIPAFSSFHFVGSLSLGKVVDPNTLEVFGTVDGMERRVKGLHVVDSSIIPKIPPRNVMALTYAVAEVASSKILGNDDDDD